MTEDIAVLLPLQLETVFLPSPGEGSWRLRLRVIPQPASVDGHTAHVTTRNAGRRRLPAARSGRPSRSPDDWFGTDDHRAAFAGLARAVGGARAVWLAEHVPARSSTGRIRAVPVAVDDAPPVVRGLPTRLQVGVWTYGRTGRSRQRDREPARRRPRDLPVAGDLPDLADAGSFLDHWVSNWAAAREAGLGGAFPLPTG